MNTLSYLNGVDVSDYNAVKLNKQAFSKVDFNLYPTLRMHFLVHAIQFQHRLPTEASMIRCERRNLRKSGQEESNKKMGRGPRINNPKQAKRLFVVPKKYGPQPIKRLRRNRRRTQMPFSMVSPNIYSPISFPMRPTFPNLYPVPGMLGMPSGMSFPRPGMPLPGTSIPGMSGISMPGISMNGMSLTGMPLSMPPISMPLVPPPVMSGPFTSIPLSSVSHPPVIGIAPSNIQSVDVRKKKKQSKKQKATVFKVKSPEQIALKSARAACRQQAQKWRNQKDPVIVQQVHKQVPVYFQKKKASQKRRRQEKHQLIKQNRKKLVQIFGNAVFQRGWPISRKEIKEALGIKNDQKEEENQLEGVFQLMQEQKIEEQIIIIPQQVNQQAKEQQISSSEQKVKLVLLIEPNTSSSLVTVPQYVLTG